jgi:ATP-dependent DNA helicase RecG
MEFKESNTIELKEKFTVKALKTISAYSNFHNGYLYIGVNDSGIVVGVPNVLHEKLNIENTINTSITPIPMYQMNILDIDGKNVIEIMVSKGNDGPYYYKNTAYMRNDTSTFPLDGPNLTRLVLSSKNITFDQVKTSENNLSFNYLKNKMAKILGVMNINQDILTTLGLFKHNLYNNAAILLSDKDELNQSYIDVAKFKLDTNTFLDRKKFAYRSILEYLDEVTEYFQASYPTYQVIEGKNRVTKEQIPLVAFRETLANAIIHRDYLLNSGIQISMFENFIEVVSPGGLPEGIDEEQYRRGLVSVSRNPIIANVFFRLNLIEQFGTGIRRINESYLQYRCKPYFEVCSSQIRIFLPVTNFDYQRLDKKEAIVSYLRANPNSPRQNIEEAVKLDKVTLIRRLNELENYGIIVRKGNGPSTVYDCK